MTICSFKTLLMGAGLTTLVACGGGGGGTDGGGGGGTPPAGGDPFGADVTPLVDLVTNDGTPTRDYLGKSFPVTFIARDAETGRGNRVAGILEYVDENTMTVTYDDVVTTYKKPDGGRNFVFDSSTDPDAPVTRLDLQDTQFWNANAGPNSTGEVVVAFPFSSDEDDLAIGVYGFVTPPDNLTGTVTYTSERGMTLMFSGPGFFDDDGTDQNHVERMETVESSFASDSMRLTADFGSNSISGTLFDDSYQATDERGITSTNSRDVLIKVENGVITGSEFTGDLTLNITPSSNPTDMPGAGGTREESDVVIQGQALDGFFLGETGKGISGSFELEYDETYQRPKGFDEPSDTDLEVTENRTIVGVFIGSEE